MDLRMWIILSSTKVSCNVVDLKKSLLTHFGRMGRRSNPTINVAQPLLQQDLTTYYIITTPPFTPIDTSSSSLWEKSQSAYSFLHRQHLPLLLRVVRNKHSNFLFLRTTSILNIYHPINMPLQTKEFFFLLFLRFTHPTFPLECEERQSVVQSEVGDVSDGTCPQSQHSLQEACSRFKARGPVPFSITN